MTVVEKIVALRAAMEAEGADGVYVPVSYTHLNRCASAGTASQKAFTPTATRSITARRASGNIWSARAKRISWCMT